MAIRCEDVTARLLELLYEELPEGERAPLQAHIDGCPRCKAELAAFAETRAVARRVLDEAPPARARAAILQAAAAHVASAKPQLAAAAPAMPARKPRATEAQPSFWDRLRGRWALPTLATVGAIAVFLLASKLLLEPNKAYQRGKEAVQPTPAAEAPVTPPVVARQQANDDGRAVPAELEKRADEAARSRPASSQPSVVSSSRPAEKQAEKDMNDRKLRPVTIGESLGVGKPAKEPARGQHAAGKVRAPGPAGGGPVGGLGGVAAGAGAAKGEKGEKGSIDDLLNDVSSSGERQRRFAPPPPARLAAPAATASRAKSEAAPEPEFAPPPPAAPAPSAQRKAKRDVSDSALEGYARDEAPMAEEAEAKPADAKAKRGPAEDKAVEKKSAAPAAASSPTAVMQSAQASAGKPSVATAPAPLVQRADRLFAEGQWAVAAVAYRDLINRYPRSGDVPRWRQRLVVAEQQYAAAEAAKAAKAAPASASPR